MSDAAVGDIFNEDRAWLAQQPVMQPWEEGCGRLRALLETHLERYSKEVRDMHADEAIQERMPYLARLWRCLGYHWRDAVAASADGPPDPHHVAQQIQAGSGYRRGGRLGGNPLRDVVLAVAMVRKDQRAPCVFQEEYFGFAKGLSGKIHSRLVAEADQWWNELVDHLAGYSRSPGRLEKYLGHSALRNWLGTVVWNFLRRWRLPEGGSPVVDDLPGASIAAADAESIQHFAGLVRSALATLSKRDRLLLALVYIDGLMQKDAASILGVHPGQVTRRLQKTLTALEGSIMRLAHQQLSPDACSGVFEDLRENPRMFATALREALEKAREGAA